MLASAKRANSCAKLRRQTFETAIIERYRRREASVEEALIEMYLAGVSDPQLPSSFGTPICNELGYNTAANCIAEDHREPP
jgi:hypothetical protein